MKLLMFAAVLLLAPITANAQWGGWGNGYYQQNFNYNYNFAPQPFMFRYDYNPILGEPLFGWNSAPWNPPYSYGAPILRQHHHSNHHNHWR